MHKEAPVRQGESRAIRFKSQELFICLAVCQDDRNGCIHVGSRPRDASGLRAIWCPILGSRSLIVVAVVVVVIGQDNLFGFLTRLRFETSPVFDTRRARRPVLADVDFDRPLLKSSATPAPEWRYRTAADERTGKR